MDIYTFIPNEEVDIIILSIKYDLINNQNNNFQILDWILEGKLTFKYMVIQSKFMK